VFETRGYLEEYLEHSDMAPLEYIGIGYACLVAYVFLPIIQPKEVPYNDLWEEILVVVLNLNTTKTGLNVGSCRRQKEENTCNSSPGFESQPQREVGSVYLACSDITIGDNGRRKSNLLLVRVLNIQQRLEELCVCVHIECSRPQSID
jgi:hypothetical protein